MDILFDSVSPKNITVQFSARDILTVELRRSVCIAYSPKYNSAYSISTECNSVNRLSYNVQQQSNTSRLCFHSSTVNIAVNNGMCCLTICGATFCRGVILYLLCLSLNLLLVKVLLCCQIWSHEPSTTIILTVIAHTAVCTHYTFVFPALHHGPVMILSFIMCHGSLLVLHTRYYIPLTTRFL